MNQTDNNVQMEIDPGMVEVSIALAGIAAAIVALIPAELPIVVPLRFLVAFLATFLALCSAYAAIWLLARYCLQQNNIKMEQISFGESIGMDKKQKAPAPSPGLLLLFIPLTFQLLAKLVASCGSTYPFGQAAQKWHSALFS